MVFVIIVILLSNLSFSCLLPLLSTSSLTLILTYLWFVQALGAGCLWFYEKFWGFFEAMTQLSGTFLAQRHWHRIVICSEA